MTDRSDILEMAQGRLSRVIAVRLRPGTDVLHGLEEACRREGRRLFMPPLKLCGDNGAMIGAQGYYEYLAGRRAGLDLNAYATMDLGEAE